MVSNRKSCKQETFNIKLPAEGLDELLQPTPSHQAFERLSRMSKRYKQLFLAQWGNDFATVHRLFVAHDLNQFSIHHRSRKHEA